MSPLSRRFLEGAEIRREVLTAEMLGIPGLFVFGHGVDRQPILPVMRHQHRTRLEFVLAAEGLRRMEADGEEYTLYPGQGFVVGPGEEHSTLESQPAPGEIYWFQLDFADTRQFLGLSAQEAGELIRMLGALRARILETPPELIRQTAQAFRLLSSDSALNRLEGRFLFLCALMGLGRCRAPLERLSPEIDRAKRYILLHLREPIDTDELLLVSGLSFEELREKFQAQLGCSPREYVIRQKIESAKGAVARSGKTTADIAYDYHFSSASFFILQFKRQTGMSPRKYRREYQKKHPKNNR